MPASLRSLPAAVLVALLIAGGGSAVFASDSADGAAVGADASTAVDQAAAERNIRALRRLAGRLPSHPVLLFGARFDPALRTAWRAMTPPDAPLGRARRDLVALAAVVHLLEADPSRHNATRAVAALVRSGRVFDVIPRALLVLEGSGDAAPLDALDILAAAGIPVTVRTAEALEEAGDERGASAGAGGGLFAVAADGLLLAAEDEETLRAALAARNGGGEALAAGVLRVRRRCAGPAWVYIDGGTLSLLPLVTDVYIPGDWAPELQAIRAIGLGFRPGPGRRRLDAYLLGTGAPDTVLSLAGRLRGTVRATAPGPDRAWVRCRFDLDWARFEPALWRWAELHWPTEVGITLTEYDELAKMTGIHIRRDFLQNFTGRIEGASLRRGGLSHSTLRFDLLHPHRVRRALDRAAVWGADFAERGLVGKRFVTLPEQSAWRLRGLPLPAFADFRLREGADAPPRLQIGTSAGAAAAVSFPEGPADISLTLDGEGQGLALRLAWRPDLRTRALTRVFASAGEAFRFTLEEGEAPLLTAVEGLRAIVMAETTYRALRLGRYNGLAADSFRRRYWRLADDRDRAGLPVLALPEILCESRYPDGRALEGVLFGPVDRVGDRAVDWRAECVFAAISDGTGDSPAGAYFAGSDGVVYYNPDADAFPLGVPANPVEADWVRLTPGWEAEIASEAQASACPSSAARRRSP